MFLFPRSFLYDVPDCVLLRWQHLVLKNTLKCQWQVSYISKTNIKGSAEEVIFNMTLLPLLQRRSNYLILIYLDSFLKRALLITAMKLRVL
jgi:hypothetical protein